MKIAVSKKYVGVIVLLLIISICMPYASVVAQSTRERGDFCSSLLNPTSPINTRIASINATFTLMGSDRTLRFERSIEEKMRARTTSQRDLDTRRGEYYEKLMQRAKNAAQKNAVSEFIAASDTAILARRNAINAAEAAYHAEVKKILTAQHPIIETAAKTFKSDIQESVANATKQCRSKIPDDEIHDTFMKELRTAHEAFKAARGDSKIQKAQINDAYKVLKTTVGKAEKLFNSTTSVAEKNLQAAFKK